MEYIYIYLIFINCLVFLNLGYNIHYFISSIESNYSLYFILNNNLFNLGIIFFMNYITYISPSIQQINNYIFLLNKVFIIVYILITYSTIIYETDNLIFSPFQLIITSTINIFMLISLVLFYSILVLKNNFEYIRLKYLLMLCSG